MPGVNKLMRISILSVILEEMQNGQMGSFCKKNWDKPGGKKRQQRDHAIT
jgi:hypothetical protein